MDQTPETTTTSPNSLPEPAVPSEAELRTEFFEVSNWLSNRVFTSYDAIVGQCCDAWNKLADQPWTIMSLGLRDWAHRY